MGQEAVKAELERRIAAIGGRSIRARRGELAAEVDAIRAIAARAGLRPAVTVAHLLDDALSRGEHGALIQSWLYMLRDAVGCDRTDAAACDAYAAACTVRFAG